MLFSARQPFQLKKLDLLGFQAEDHPHNSTELFFIIVIYSHSTPDFGDHGPIATGDSMKVLFRQAANMWMLSFTQRSTEAGCSRSTLPSQLNIERAN